MRGWSPYPKLAPDLVYLIDCPRFLKLQETGKYGSIDGTILKFSATPADPRWEGLPWIWISENAVCYPKNVSNGIIIQGITYSTSKPFLRNPITGPLETAHLSAAVEESLSTSGLEMEELSILVLYHFPIHNKYALWMPDWGVTIRRKFS